MHVRESVHEEQLHILFGSCQTCRAVPTVKGVGHVVGRMYKIKDEEALCALIALTKSNESETIGSYAVHVAAANPVAVTHLALPCNKN